MKSAASLARKYKKPSWYHSVAAKNRLGAISESAFLPEESDDGLPQEPPLAAQPTAIRPTTAVETAKRDLLDALNKAGGDAGTPAVQTALQELLRRYDPSHFDPRKPVPRYAKACNANQFEGIGISAGKPTFPGCIGHSSRTGDPMYKLGAMSFDMYCPTQLVVSVQGSFVLIDTVDGRTPTGVKHVPKHLLADVRFGRTPVRTYDIVTPFTIEPWQPGFGEDSPNKGVDQPIQGVMTTYGFLLPYPTKHRFAVWFTGGSLEVDDHKNEKWFQIFDKEAAPKRTVAESGKVLAAKLLMGASASHGEMDKDGKLSYSLSRPKASHIDLVYLDKTIQVLRASSGTVYVHVRLPGSRVVQESALFDQPLPTPVDPLLQLEESTSVDGNQLQVGSESGIQYLELMTERIDQRNVIQSTHTPRLGSPIQRAVSESNIQDVLQQEQSSAVDARLQELQSFVVDPTEGKKKSCLKRTSSYGDLEELGTNIPISDNRRAWIALPRPRSPDKPKKTARRPWRHRRRASEPADLMLNGDVCNFKDEDQTCRTSESDFNEDTSKRTEILLPQAPKLRKSVSFSCLEIRNYDITVGDNPSCHNGPPVSLDWTYQSVQSIPVSATRNHETPKPRRMGNLERNLKLRKEFGVGMTDIVTATKEVERIKHQREFTSRYMARPSAMKVEGAVESVQRKAKRVVQRLKPQKKDPSLGYAKIA